MPRPYKGNQIKYEHSEGSSRYPADLLRQAQPAWRLDVLAGLFRLHQPGRRPVQRSRRSPRGQPRVNPGPTVRIGAEHVEMILDTAVLIGIDRDENASTPYSVTCSAARTASFSFSRRGAGLAEWRRAGSFGALHRGISIPPDSLSTSGGSVPSAFLSTSAPRFVTDGAVVLLAEHAAAHHHRGPCRHGAPAPLRARIIAI